jgi:phosphoglycerate dehydrogenase-like enzyme
VSVLEVSARPRVFVAQPVPPVAVDRLREYAEVEVFPWSNREISIDELEAAARRTDYFFLMHSTPVTAAMVAANPHLRGSACARPRDDVHDLGAVEAAGIPFLLARSPDPATADNGRDTANLMVALILNLAYRVAEADRYCRDRGMFQEMTMDLMGLGCTNKTVSLIGLGRVARHAAKRLRAMGMTVLYMKRTRLDPEEESAVGVEWCGDLDDLIARGDYVSMCANYERANEKLMGAREFGLMKPTAYFINIGRGRLVDEDAMVQALDEGRIAGAGLDVFWNEPPVVRDALIPAALRRMDNVVLTPHNGGATWTHREQQMLAIAEAIVEDIVRRESEMS